MAERPLTTQRNRRSLRNRLSLAVSLVLLGADRVDALVFVIEDDGPGVPDAALGQIAAPGMRIDEQRPGHGLGLAIVGDIVAQYGGSIRYDRSASMGGLRVVGKLPLDA